MAAGRFRFQTGHFEKVAEGFETGAARHDGEISRYRRDIVGHRRAVAGLACYRLTCHCGPVDTQEHSRFGENTRFVPNSNLLIAMYNKYILELYTCVLGVLFMPYLLALTRLPHRPDLTASAAFPMFRVR